MNFYKRGILLTSIGAVFIATSPVLTRLAEGLPSGEIAFFRLLFGSFFIFTISRFMKDDMRLEKKRRLKIYYL